MIIREATFNDLPSLVEIYNQAIAKKKTADTSEVTVLDRTTWFETQTFPILVGVKDHEVLGYLSLSAHRPGRQALKHTVEVSFYVHDNHQRQGVASSLLKRAIDQSLVWDIKTLFAILLENNVASIELLEKFGFERWGHLPDVADFGGLEVGQFYYGLRVAPK